MRGLRSKILFALVMYCGGFATALYFLAPVDKDAKQCFISDFKLSSLENQDQDHEDSSAANLGEGIRKCVGMLHCNATELGNFVQSKLNLNFKSNQHDQSQNN